MHIVADRELDMVADMELGKVNDMVAEMEVDMVATITKLFKLKLLQSQTFSSQCFRERFGDQMSPKSWHCQNWFDHHLILASWRIWPKKRVNTTCDILRQKCVNHF